MNRPGRRRFVAGLAGAIALPALPRAARAQTDPLDPMVWVFTKGAPVQKGRVKLELPPLADNGNSVPLMVTVDSPMSATDYVKSIHLFSDKNPVRDMARFYLGPRGGRAKVVTRVRLAGTQTVTAIAPLSDGTFWWDSAPVEGIVSACMEES